MAQRKVPRHIPFIEFLKRYPLSAKISFLLLLAVLAFSCTLLVISVSDPARWSVKVAEITSQRDGCAETGFSK